MIDINFKIGEKIRLKSEAILYEEQDFICEGWSGYVQKISKNETNLELSKISIFWDIITLNKLPLKYHKRANEGKINATSIEVFITQIERSVETLSKEKTDAAQDSHQVVTSLLNLLSNEKYNPWKENIRRHYHSITEEENRLYKKEFPAFKKNIIGPYIQDMLVGYLHSNRSNRQHDEPIRLVGPHFNFIYLPVSHEEKNSENVIYDSQTEVHYKIIKEPDE